MSPANPSLVYAVGTSSYTGKVYRSDNAGGSWTDRTANLGSLQPGSWTAYAVCLGASGRVFLGSSRGVYRSSNGGVSWENAGLNNTSTVALAYSPTAGVLYAGTGSYGVYQSADGGDSWEEMNQGLVFRQCSALALDETSGCLLLSTPGSSVWRRRLWAGVAPGGDTFWFRATALTNNVLLRWHDPTACGLSNATVRIRRDTGGYPQNPSDGTPVYQGTARIWDDAGLTPYQPYYYTIWVSHDGTTFLPPPP
ncbi:MAG: hypothetical protein JXR37_13760 [Kiritimatiellae bacterium]|nr:hypothetical protein [Kiritimatiellia bacterium]